MSKPKYMSEIIQSAKHHAVDEYMGRVNHLQPFMKNQIKAAFLSGIDCAKNIALVCEKETEERAKNPPQEISVG